MFTAVAVAPSKPPRLIGCEALDRLQPVLAWGEEQRRRLASSPRVCCLFFRVALSTGVPVLSSAIRRARILFGSPHRRGAGTVTQFIPKIVLKFGAQCCVTDMVE